ncbi:hypothetical protein JMJ77_0015010, partial [Colletotrichum scovillei]
MIWQVVDRPGLVCFWAFASSPSSLIANAVWS